MCLPFLNMELCKTKKMPKKSKPTTNVYHHCCDVYGLHYRCEEKGHQQPWKNMYNLLYIYTKIRIECILLLIEFIHFQYNDCINTFI